MDTYSTDMKQLLADEIEEYPSHLPYALAQYVHDTVGKALVEERRAVLTIFETFQKPGCEYAHECRDYIEAALKARANFG
jgi:hypothetical protein